jgi:serine/threonine-protein phosphatase 6 regulatory ankyrin repeat subunit B
MAQMLLEATEAQGLEDRDSKGRTVMHYAADGGNEEVVALLLSKGAQANTKDEDQRTPFIVACARCKLQALQVLLKHMGGQTLDDRDKWGKTALRATVMWWCTRAASKVVKVLLLAGADPSIPDNEGLTPRQKAEQSGRAPLVEIFKVRSRVSYPVCPCTL